MPAEGGTTGELVGTFAVTVSEALNPETVNTPVYEWFTFGGHTYLLTPSDLQWPDAEAFAQSLGGHLVTIDNQAEQDQLFSQFGSVAHWIGLSDAAEEGTFTWASGEAVTYTNWASGLPYGDYPNYRDYVVLDTDGSWYNYDYNFTNRRGIIEIPGDADTDLDGTPDAADSHPGDAFNGWDLRAAGADGQFDTADDDVYDLRLASTYSSGTTINLRVYDGPLHEGNYRLLITPSLTDVVGSPLDGDGNGVGGDAYEQFFTVDLPAGYVYEGRHNDTLAQATPLTLAEDPAQPGLFVTPVFGLGSQDPAYYGTNWSDADYWSFEAQAGDRVAIAVDTPDSGVDPYVELRNSSDSNLAGDDSGGPDGDAYISHYVIPTTGTYYIAIGKYYYSTVAGSYQVRVELARGMDLESDSSYGNDSNGGANPVTLIESGNVRSGTVAGTIMTPEGNNTDEDRYALGFLNAGNLVELDLRLPNFSTLVPQLRVVDESGNVIADEDDDPSNGFRATITADSNYYAEVSNQYWVRNGHIYQVLGSQTWQSAEAAAAVLGGHLVTINEQAEQDWIYNTFSRFGNVWIGINDYDTEGTWVWADGTPVSYTNWGPNEPDSGDSYDGGYQYSGNGQWYGYYFGTEFAGIVEQDDPFDRTSGGPGPRRSTCSTSASAI